MARKSITGRSADLNDLSQRMNAAADAGGGIQAGAHPELSGEPQPPKPKKPSKSMIAAADKAYLGKQYQRVDQARAVKGLPALPKPGTPQFSQ